MRRKTSILLATLCAVACTTPVDVRKSAFCKGKLEMVSKKQDRSTELWVRNGCHVPMTVELRVDPLHNVAADQPLPVLKTLDAESELRFVTLTAPNAPQSWSYQAHIAGKTGSPPQPDPAIRYRFPFGGDLPRRLSQGVDGGSTHKGLSSFAFDFEMPVGTPVLAARGGVVLAVVDGYSAGGRNVDPNNSNSVLIYHDDDTVAMYSHLRSGIPVVAGDIVGVGALLGLSGNSGFSTGPHLHFAVGHMFTDGGEFNSLPILFEGDRVPAQGKAYQPQEPGAASPAR